MGSWAQVAGAWEMHLFQAIRGWKMWNWRLFFFFHRQPCSFAFFSMLRLCTTLWNTFWILDVENVQREMRLHTYIWLFHWIALEVEAASKGLIMRGYGVQQESGLLQGSSGSLAHSSLQSANVTLLFKQCQSRSCVARSAQQSRSQKKAEALKMHKQKGSEWGARGC